MFNFAKSTVHVLDVGSSTLTVMTGVSCGSKLTMLKSFEIAYAGFLNEKFLEIEQIESKVAKAIENIELSTQLQVKNIAVGVPAEFCYSITKKLNATFSVKQKITKEVLDEVYEKAKDVFGEYTLLDIQPIQAILDDEQKCISPLGQKATKISVLVNVMYAKTEFIKLFNDILANLGVEKVTYISSPLCVAQNMLKDLSNEVCVVDVGYLTSSVCVSQGLGLKNLFSFSFGGAQIEAELMDKLALTYNEAEDLKKNIVLTLDPKNSDYYETSNFGKTRKILVKNANQIVLDKLETLAYVIKSCIEQCEIEGDFPLFLTGGGISQVQGAKMFLEKYLNKKINILSPNILGFNKPYQTSCIALLLSQVKLQ